MEDGRTHLEQFLIPYPYLAGNLQDPDRVETERRRTRDWKVVPDPLDERYPSGSGL